MNAINSASPFNNNLFMKQLVLIILFFCAFDSTSQVRFNNTYDYGRNEWQQNLIINDQGEYVTIGWSIITNDSGATIFNKYDEFGNSIDTNLIEFLDSITVLGWAGTIKQHSITKEYFVSGAIQWYDTLVAGGGWSQLFLAKLKPNGDLSFFKVWGDTNEFYISANIEAIGSDAFIIGASVAFGIGAGYIKDFYVAKIDTSGVLIWEKRYITPINDLLFKLFVNKENSKIYIAGGHQLSPADNFAKPIFKIIDSSGNLLFTKEWNAPTYSSGAIVIDRQLTDTNRVDRLLVVSSLDTVVVIDSFTNHYYVNRPRISATDTNLNIIWEKNIFDSVSKVEWYNAKALKNGRIIVAGAKLLVSGFDWEGWAVLLDDHGNTIWDRTYTKRQTTHYFTDVQECDDGGFIFTGTVLSSLGFPTDDAWLVKVDSLGCEVPNCTPMSVPKEVYNSSSLLVYPNPASKQLRIELINSKNSKESYYVYNAIGQFILDGELKLNQKSILDISNLANGIYYIKCVGMSKKFVKE